MQADGRRVYGFGVVIVIREADGGPSYPGHAWLARIAALDVPRRARLEGGWQRHRGRRERRRLVDMAWHDGSTDDVRRRMGPTPAAAQGQQIG